MVMELQQKKSPKHLCRAVKSKLKKVYTPNSLLRSPIRLLFEIKSDFKQSLDLSFRLAVRDISAQYRQTFLGYFWAILPPILTSLIFIILNNSSLTNLSSSKIPYVVFVFTSTVFWQLFVDSMNAPLKFVTQNRSMLTKINFPRESIIFSGIIQVLFSLLIKLILLIAIILFFQTPVENNIFRLFLSLISILVFGTLCGIILVPIGVLYSDIQQAIAIFIPALMLLTPVVYLPPESGLLLKINMLNPITYLIISARDSLFLSDQIFFNFTLKIAGVSFFALLLSFIVYRIALPHLIERMEA